MSVALACEACGASMARGDRFCEQCGGRLADDPCRACGAGVDADGFCTSCGVRAHPPDSRLEVDLGDAAGVCDRGRVRARNEDALYLETLDAGVAAVVCDGISASPRAADAAQSAAEAAGRELAAAVRGRAGLSDAMSGAIRTAQHAVAQLAGAPTDAPACTLVAAVWRDGELVVGWAGDSRAYWNAEPLTADDASAHVVTRWLGADAPDLPPHVVSLAVADGRLVLCSDGLWNYASAEAELRTRGPPIAAARTLVQHALDAGGRDNVSVIVVELPLARRAAA